MTHVNTKAKVEGEPDDDDWSEEAANLRGTQRLDQEQ